MMSRRSLDEAMALSLFYMWIRQFSASLKIS